MKERGRWFRFYERTLDNPKMQRLPGETFKALVNLWCLASKHNGVLPTIEDCAFVLRKSEAQVRKLLSDFADQGFMLEIDPGCFAPTDWNEWQYKSDVSTDRVKRFRKRQRNVSETAPETDTESETDIAAVSACAREDKILEAIGVADSPNWFGHKPQLARWLDEFDWDLELDVLPTVKRMVANMSRPPNTPRYFEQAIADAKAERLRPAPKGQATGAKHERPINDQSNSLAAAARKRLAEFDQWEAEQHRPGTGEAGLRGGGPNVRLLSPRGSG